MEARELWRIVVAEHEDVLRFEDQETTGGAGRLCLLEDVLVQSRL